MRLVGTDLCETDPRMSAGQRKTLDKSKGGRSMTTVIVWFVIIYAATLPVRLASRRRARAATPPPVVVVVIQPAAAPPAPLTLEQEWQAIQARDGAR